MGERTAPPPSAAALQTGDISAPDGLARDNRWPPRGWPMFSCITRTSGTATATERGSPEGAFLKYDLSINDDGIYCIEITSGNMGRKGTSLAPAMGIRFAAREDWFDENPQNAVMDIHIQGQNLIPERGAVLRVILAMTYLISRIDRGVAPNLKRVLKIYRLA